MASIPLGLFVEVSSLIWDQSFGGARNWLDRIVTDYRPRMETLALIIIAKKDDNGGISLYETELDSIKDYLPQFDYLFIGHIPPNAVVTDFNIRKASHRSAHINAARDVANQFIQYLRDRNITIPIINWYIEPEANLNSFGQFDGDSIANAYKEYILQFTDVLTNVSHDNGLNEPEFLWSPYFPSSFLSQITRTLLKNRLGNLLASVPRLRWLHVQDGVGARSTKHPNGHVTYRLTAEDVIWYDNNILVPVSGTLESNRINMEFFVFDEQGNMPPGDPGEHVLRQRMYEEANVPIGISFEIRYWYGSLYYVTVPNVIGMDAGEARARIGLVGLVPIIIGSGTNAKVLSQSPLGGDFVAIGSNVSLTTSDIVLVPHVIGIPVEVASQDIQHAGLVPKFSGSGTWVSDQSPGPGHSVARGSTVTMTTQSGSPP